MNDHELAADLARRAGELLVSIRGSGREAGKRGDRESNAFLLSELRSHRPADAILSEESVDDRARLDARRVWIVDPLDGTREFGEPPRDDWAVHVALWEEGKLSAAAVALPARGTVLSTLSPPVAAAGGGGRVRIVVSRTRPPSIAEKVASELDAELVPMGSAGAKVSVVVLGEADAYLHAGGQYEWDSAAPVGVAHAAGVHASRIDGSPLRYNQSDPSLPDLLVCRPDLAVRFLDVIADSS